RLVALILAPGELALLLARQQRTVADLADVQPQRIAGGRSLGGGRGGLGLVVIRLFVRGDDLEGSVLRRFRKQVGHFHVPPIGSPAARLEHSRYPARGMAGSERTFRI